VIGSELGVPTEGRSGSRLYFVRGGPFTRPLRHGRVSAVREKPDHPSQPATWDGGRKARVETGSYGDSAGGKNSCSARPLAGTAQASPLGGQRGTESDGPGPLTKDTNPSHESTGSPSSPHWLERRWGGVLGSSLERPEGHARYPAAGERGDPHQLLWCGTSTRAGRRGRFGEADGLDTHPGWNRRGAHGPELPQWYGPQTHRSASTSALNFGRR